MKLNTRLMVCVTITIFIIAGMSTGLAEEQISHKINDESPYNSTLGPDLIFAPTYHNFENVAEGYTYETTFQIRNGGNGTLVWNLTAVQPWIAATPLSGTSTSPWDITTITVTIDTTGLSVGSYTGDIEITANDGGGIRYFRVYFNIVNSNPPNTPAQLDGPTEVEEGIWYSYTTSTIDPDGDQIRYGFDANNDDIIQPDDWTDTYYPSGYTVTINFIFFDPGTRHIRAKAEDEYGLQSGFSPPLIVTVTEGNDRPNPPAQPTGPVEGTVETSYSFSTNAIDPNDDQLRYGWDWNGNGTVDEWTESYDSGETITTSHTFDTPGTYQIKVKAKDEHDVESNWSLAHNITILPDNSPPNKPATPQGRNDGKIRRNYMYTTVTTDPDGDQVWYQWDWGDEVSAWDGPYESGETVTASHTWTTQGTYPVKVKAKDSNDLESVWSDPLPVSMPKSKFFFPFQGILELFPGLETVLNGFF